jgi:rifampicin phosphotransferase
MKDVVELSEVRFSDREIAGGKGAALGELIHSGVNVPRGFIVTTNVWNKYRESSSLTLTDLQIIEETVIKYSSSKHAVRSSAVVEDGKSASWAGQFGTFLNVEKKDVAARVRECMQTLFPSTLVYGKKQGTDTPGTAIAVIVQEMVHPAFAGVAFSANPVSKNTNEIVIEAVEGLGTGVVDGSQDPDFYRIDKISTNVLEFREASGNKFVSESKILQLVELTKNIESLFGSPQDIEWAYVGDDLYILQSRSITTL